MSEIDTLILCAERYAIGLYSYESGEVAQEVAKFVENGALKRATRLTLAADIKEAFSDNQIRYDDTKLEWRKTLSALKSSLEFGL